MGQGGALCSCPPEQPVASCRPFWNGPPRRAHQTLGIRGVGGGAGTALGVLNCAGEGCCGPSAGPWGLSLPTPACLAPTAHRERSCR